MHKNFIFAALAATCYFTTATVCAAAIPSYQLEEIIVTAQPPNAAVTSDSIDSKYVSPGRYASVPELLQYTAGIDVRLRGTYGDNQNDTVKIRGLDANRYNVLLDGQPLKMSGVMGGNFIDWNSIPLESIEKIQITKGGKLASSGDIGGTINIITKKEPQGGSASFLTGEQGRYDYRLNYGFKSGKLNTFISGAKSGIDGYLLNNDFDSEQYNIKMDYKFTTNDSLRLGYSKNRLKRGYVLRNISGEANYAPGYPETPGDGLIQPQPGQIGQPGKYGRGSYWSKDTDHYNLSYKHDFDNGFVQFDYYRNNEERHEVLKDHSGKVQLDRIIPSDKSDYFAVSGESAAGIRHTLGYGVQYQRLRYGYGHYNVRPTNSGDLYPSQKIDNSAIYAEDNWQLDERWKVYLGLRYDHYKANKDDEHASKMQNVSENSLSPKFSLLLNSDANNSSSLSINRVWRAPSMPEYYWWSQNYSDNKFTNSLKPEHGLSYELGHKHKFDKRYSTKINLYYQDINDYINFRHYAPFRAYNIDNAKLWGTELTNEIKFDQHNTLLVNYTNQHTRKNGVAGNDLNNGLHGELDYSPRHKIGLAYLYDSKLWKLRYNINYISSQKDSPAGESGAVYRIGGYTVHSLAVIRTLNKNTDLSLFIDNIFDKKYVEQYGYPMPGRLFSAALTYKF